LAFGLRGANFIFTRNFLVPSVRRSKLDKYRMVAGTAKLFWDLWNQKQWNCCLRAQLPLDFERPVERLIHGGELHVGLRDFDDNVPIGDSFRLELDVNFEIRAVLTDKCFSS